MKPTKSMQNRIEFGLVYKRVLSLSDYVAKKYPVIIDQVDDIADRLADMYEKRWGRRPVSPKTYRKRKKIEEKYIEENARGVLDALNRILFN